MQINGSLPLQFLNNPQPGTASDAGQNRQAAGNGVQNTAINPPTAVNPANQAQPGTPARSAVQTRPAPTSASTSAAQARPATNNATPSSDSGQNASPRLDVFA